MSAEAVYSRESMIAGLKALGLKRGDCVLMHSDLRSLAQPREVLAAGDQGGMDWLIEALREVLGPSGLLAVPTFTKCFKPGEPGPTGQVWHPDKTPSRVGQITNYLLGLPDRKRSDHPTHSVAAIGRDADAFCRGHSWREGATTFDRNGPWGHLVDADGYLLWLGTDMRTQTCVHVVEDWMRLPYMATCVALVNDHGVTREVNVTQSPAGPRDFYRKGSKVEQAWNAAGKGRRGKVCRADGHLMGAGEFFEWLRDALLKDPALLLSDDPQDPWSVEARQKTAAYLAQNPGFAAWNRG